MTSRYIPTQSATHVVWDTPLVYLAPPQIVAEVLHDHDIVTVGDLLQLPSTKVATSIQRAKPVVWLAIQALIERAKKATAVDGAAKPDAVLENNHTEHHHHQDTIDADREGHTIAQLTSRHIPAQNDTPAAWDTSVADLAPPQIVAHVLHDYGVVTVGDLLQLPQRASKIMMPKTVIRALKMLIEKAKNVITIDNEYKTDVVLARDHEEHKNREDAVDAEYKINEVSAALDQFAAESGAMERSLSISDPIERLQLTPLVTSRLRYYGTKTIEDLLQLARKGAHISVRGGLA